ncbi:MAG: aspartate--tRNA(Asn) ligase [Nitrososphaerales archaeon]
MESQARHLRIRQVFSSDAGENVEIRGWVATKNAIGGLVFAVVRDGTGYIQVSAKGGVAPPDSMEAIKLATKESAVSVTGLVRDDKRAPRGKEISVRGFRVLSRAETWPITKTAVKSASYLYDIRHLSIRSRKVVATMKIRNEVVGATFDYFRDQGFTLISAPSFVQAAVEGGSTLFGVDYFGKKVYLSQSAQFYEEAALAALEKVWIYQPAFRAEKSRTPKHLTEFWMIEAEQAFADQSDNMSLQEGLLSSITHRVTENRSDELKVLGRTIAELSLPFERISYDEVREFADKQGLPYEWGEDVPTEVERLISLTRQRPFFITDYPLSARSFYHMTYPDRPKVTKSADLIAPEGFGELATGGQRIASYEVLMERIKSQDLPTEAFGWYLDLRKYGMPDHAGFGMGVERVTRWLAGLKHIRGASLFPRTTTRVSP